MGSVCVKDSTERFADSRLPTEKSMHHLFHPSVFSSSDEAAAFIQQKRRPNPLKAAAWGKRTDDRKGSFCSLNCYRTACE
jgi:hypothetical protein